MSRRRKRADCRVFFEGEAPSIGCGMRGITIIKVGRKWVRIRETATGASARLAKAVWQRLYAEEVSR